MTGMRIRKKKNYAVPASTSISICTSAALAPVRENYAVLCSSGPANYKVKKTHTTKADFAGK
jgi:hypothetical protein